MNLPLRITIEDVSSQCGLSPETILYYIDEEWINPIDRESLLLDEEDVARINLIKELKINFDVNDESIGIILHLIDRIQLLHLRLKRMQ